MTRASIIQLKREAMMILIVKIAITQLKDFWAYFPLREVKTRGINPEMTKQTKEKERYS